MVFKTINIVTPAEGRKDIVSPKKHLVCLALPG